MITGGLRAFQRGGNWNNGSNAGVFTLNLNNAPSNTNTNIGFRVARDSNRWPDMMRVIVSSVPLVSDHLVTSLVVALELSMTNKQEASRFSLAGLCYSHLVFVFSR